MLISELGEFGLIDRIKRKLDGVNRGSLGPAVIKGIGDDCAVLPFRKNTYLLLTSDMIIEGVDFKPGESPELIGRKALAVSLSDIAACAGLPRYALVSLGIKKNADAAVVDGIVKGMAGLAKRFKVRVVGGDTSRAKHLTLDVMLAGEVEKKYLALRSGARVNDCLCVTGALGGSLYGRHLRFMPRIEEARFLASHFSVTSMIDISDGLLQDLTHILKASSAGAVVYESAIPVHADARSAQEALWMGEDFELLFTVHQKQLKRLKASGYTVTPIGHIVDKRFGLRLLDSSGSQKPIKHRGFTHF